MAEGLADDSLLLLFWTVLAVLFGIFVLWKYLKPRNGIVQQLSTSQESENVKEARLKYFAGREEIASNNAEVIAHEVNTKQENVLEEEVSQEERESESADTSVVSEGFQPPVRYTKLIGGPSKKCTVTYENENSVFDPDTSAPITRPLRTLEDVLSWRQGFDFFNVATVFLTAKGRKLERRPRTLVCHDMKGGYIEDRSV